MKKLICLTLLLSCCTAMTCHAITPIRIALVGPLTGPYAAYGIQLLSGASQAVNDINAQGGINGVPIEIMPLDDQCDTDLAVARADEIIRSQQYNAVIGHTCSGSTLATANLYAKAQILMITPTATNQQITERNINTLFRMSGNDAQQSQLAADFIANKLHAKRVAILHDDELYSKGLADLVSENLIQYNVSPALYQTVDPGTRNYTKLVKKLKALQIDAIYFAGLYPEIAKLLITLNALEMQIPLVTADGIALEQFIADVGNATIANSVMFTFSTDPKNIISSRKVIHAMQESNLPTHGYSLYAYAAVQVIADAMQKANTFDALKLANWLHCNSVDTILGKKSWDTNGDIIDNQFKMFAWQDHKGQLSFVEIH